MSMPSSLYRRHRFPSEIISHCVWLYFRFALSVRDVEEIMAVRGVFVTYEAIREWSLKFGQTYANELRRKRPRPGDKWHLDEMFIKINGEDHYLWRSVDQDGNVLDILVQSRRNKKAAKRLFRKLLKGLQYVPRVIITDKLKSYGAAKAEIMPGVEHYRHKGLNNRAENSHQPTRVRERVMRRFKSAGHAQRFLSAFGIIASHFRPRRHLLTAERYREEMRSKLATWTEVSCVQMAA
jgi:putative transposase